MLISTKFHKYDLNYGIIVATVLYLIFGFRQALSLFVGEHLLGIA